MLKEHLEKLHYFYEIAKAGSFNKASRTLFITQPSLTKSIKVLEESIQIKLFLRTPKGVILSEEGKLLFEYCVELFYKLDEVEGLLLNKNDPMNATVRIGTYDSLAIYFWPKFIKHISKKYPNLNIQLSTNRSHTILSELENGVYDLALTVDPKKVKNIISKSSINDHFKFYTTTNSEIADYSDLAIAPIIYMPQAIQNLSSEFKQNLKSLIENRKVYETSSLESAKALAINGIGIALLPSLVASYDVSKKNLVAINIKSTIPLKRSEHSISISYSKFKENSDLIQKLVVEISSFIKKKHK
ncbi:hypothetical protein A9Q84_02945 [Halobacteriovorax marinus]|uniref:HTH lysR-type domain-containing protein n=1 Tax=Halobacteriovorax marinus TaxID=97084 RepID=A0A1Y5FGV7_9BACT|nr:hypothetical protein A9Q84_02945 [Halobacteriovorax marinus]